MSQHCLIVSLCLTLFFAHGCKETKVEIEFVLPSQYSGFFWVVIDPKGGIDPPTNNGKVVLQIPENGVLVVKEDSYLSEWHTTSGRDSSGRSLKVAPFDRERGNEPMIRPVGSSSYFHAYFYGEREIAEEYMNGGPIVLQSEKELKSRLEKMGISVQSANDLQR